jgi:tRNA/rRNA methyltransferase
MLSCGIERLIIAGTSKGDFDDEEIRKFAIHAYPVYERAAFAPRLGEALASSVIAVGMSRRIGGRRKEFSLTPEELAVRLAHLEGTISLVFGNERTGLTDEEMRECDLACHIPTSPQFPSLNLSHAVQVIGYVLFRADLEEESLFRAIPRDRLADLVGGIIASLKKLGYFTLTDGSYTARLLKEVFSRGGLTDDEARRIERMFAAIPYLAGRAQSDRGSTERPDG